MKREPPIALTALTFLLLFLLPSCSKVREFIEDHPAEIGKFCSIDSLAFFGPSAGGESGLMHFKIFNDGAGNPLELRQLDDLVLGVYGEDMHFRYDRKGRLTDVLQTDPGMTFVYVWNRYTYPSQRTIIDSIFDYQGSLNDPNPPYLPGLSITITLMQLDEEGRPVKFETHNTAVSGPPSSYEVSYDRNGNLVSPGVTYDDKVNIYQTSRTWQLFYGDFSRNNPNRVANEMSALPATPAAYDAYGLPTEFLRPAGTIFGFGFAILTVKYSCDVAGPPIPSSE
jgi:hypothetical protein